MNELFVSIKVDREERPDVDDVYMKAVQLLIGRGGWPLTAFLTPDRRPFHGGNVLPARRPSRTARIPARAPSGRAGVSRAPRRRRSSHRGPGRRHRSAPSSAGPTSRGARSRRCPTRAAEALLRHVDRRHGGLGGAPKFPHTQALPAVPAPVRERPDGRSARGRHASPARRMAAGGMYDQIGGGFHRYSVDERWLVPHFEKMLYDNAQLPRLYLDAHPGDRRRPSFAGVVVETSTTCCARCVIPGAGSTRRPTPTAKARKASSSSGRPPRWPRSSARRRRARLPVLGHNRARATSRGGASRTRRHRRRRARDVDWSLDRGDRRRASIAPAPLLYARAPSASRRCATRRSSPPGTRSRSRPLAEAGRVLDVARVRRRGRRGGRVPLVRGPARDGRSAARLGCVARRSSSPSSTTTRSSPRRCLDLYEATADRTSPRARARADRDARGALPRRPRRLLLHARRRRDARSRGASRAPTALFRRATPSRRWCITPARAHRRRAPSRARRRDPAPLPRRPRPSSRSRTRRTSKRSSATPRRRSRS